MQLRDREWQPLPWGRPSVVIAGLAAMGLCLLVYELGEIPLLEGRPLWTWVEDLEHQSPMRRRAASQCLRRHAGEVEPFLRSVLKSHEPDHHQSDVVRLIQEIITPGESNESWYQKGMAARGLGVLGVSSIPTIDVLKQARRAGNAFLSIRAEIALIQIRGDPLESCLRELNHLDSPKWFRTVAVLTGLGEECPPEAAARLHHLLPQLTPAQFEAAMQCLAWIDSGSKKVEANAQLEAHRKLHQRSQDSSAAQIARD